MTPTSENNTIDRYAEDENEAEARHSAYRAIDPFPEIESALLNSADICDYVALTGMIWPFRQDKKYLKPASYGARLKGRCIYWDENGTKHDFILSNEMISEYPNLKHVSEFKLTRNSIAFVTLDAYIRLPEYIAMRFNLTIRDVYRGLLLGTGPLVDPGFKGRLSFPIHNLTNNDYILKADDELVWMEFTKISRNDKWRNSEVTDSRERSGVYYSFPEQKLERKDVSDYLFHARGGDDIRSSIPIEVSVSKEKAEEAAKRAEAASKWFRNITIGGIIVFLLTVVGVIYAGYQLVGGTLSLVQANQIALREISINAKGLEISLDQTRNQIFELETIVSEFDPMVSTAGRREDELRDRLSRISEEIEAMRDRLEQIESRRQ